MIDHIGLNVSDIEAAKNYYDRLMPSLGYAAFFATDDQFSYQPEGGKPGTTVFFYAAPLPNEYVRKHVGLEHLAFRARTRSQVDEAHAKALELGSQILFGPRLFPQYHKSYYGAFWFDPTDSYSRSSATSQKAPDSTPATTNQNDVFQPSGADVGR